MRGIELAGVDDMFNLERTWLGGTIQAEVDAMYNLERTQLITGWWCLAWVYLQYLVWKV